MTKKIVISILIINISFLFGCLDEAISNQAKSKTFLKYINGGFIDKAVDILENTEGFFILLGTSSGFNEDNTELERIRLIKTDRYGIVSWSVTYPPHNPQDKNDTISYHSNAIQLLQDESGYLIVGGSTNLKTNITKPILLAVDDNKQTVKRWYLDMGVYEGTTDSLRADLTSVTFDAEEAYLVMGRITSLNRTDPANNQKDIMLAAINKNFHANNEGNIAPQWMRRYGIRQNNTGINLPPSVFSNRIYKNDNTIFWASIYHNNLGSNVAFTGVLYNSPSIAFNRVLTRQQSIEQDDARIGVGDICILGDKYVIISTSTNTIGQKSILLKQFSKNGLAIEGEEYNHTYGDITYNYEGISVSPTKEGGLILLATTNDPQFVRGGKDFFLIKTDPFGQPTWTRTIGRRDDDIGKKILVTQDNYYVIFGTTSFGGSDNTIVLIKTNEQGFF